MHPSIGYHLALKDHKSRHLPADVQKYLSMVLLVFWHGAFSFCRARKQPCVVF